jgi:hypothetical protein
VSKRESNRSATSDKKTELIYCPSERCFTALNALKIAICTDPIVIQNESAAQMQKTAIAR